MASLSVDAGAHGDRSSRTSHTYSQLGLDADDALFGGYSHALLECETLAAFHDSNPRADVTSTSARALASRILFPLQQRALQASSRNSDQRSPFRVAIARNAQSNAETHNASSKMGPAAFNVDTPLPDPTSIAGDTASFEPGSAAWRVRTAFADRAASPGSEDVTVDDAPQRAIGIMIPAKTLFQCVWLDTSFATVLMWALPSAIAILNYTASSPSLVASQSNSSCAIGFFACGLLLLALVFSRIETASLLRKLLFTFEAVYLIVWILVYLVVSIAQIPHEIELRTVKLGMDSGQYIFFCAATLFCVALCFAVVLFSDALVHLSSWFKIYIHAMFLVVSLYTWIGIRFIRPDRSPIEICVGNSSYSCSDTGRIRVGALFAISLFVFRNIVIMMRHECRDSSDHFGGMRTQRFLLIKSAVILNADEIYVSTRSPASVEPEAPLQSASSVTSLKSTNHLSSSATSRKSDMRVVDMESEIEPSSISDPLESSAIVRVIGVIPGNASESPDQPQSASESSPIIPYDASLSTPPAEVVIVATDSVAHNVQELTVFSMFGIDVDSRVQPQRMLFGTTMARLWQSPWFVAQFICNLIALVACFVMQEPNTSVTMIFIVFAIAALFFFQISTLIHMRILRHLVDAFEFWFLQVINFVAFVTLSLNILKEADGVAEFTGRDRTIQFWFDICWNFVGFAGCAVVGVADALMIRRRLKILLIAFWSLNLFREMWWWMWIKYQRPYTLPLDLCISTECFSTQIIRLQTTMTFAVFSAKYAFSLVRYPRALVILKSTIVMGVTGTSTNAGGVSCRVDSHDPNRSATFSPNVSASFSSSKINENAS